jgi:hypothetical protein
VEIDRSANLLFGSFACTRAGDAFLRVGEWVGGWGKTDKDDLFVSLAVPGGPSAANVRGEAAGFFSCCPLSFGLERAPGLRAEEQGIDARLDGPRAHRSYGTGGA